jgi:hypothetical protein
VARWVCPNCEREFGAVNQAHTCVPGITVEHLLGRHPVWVGEIYRAMMAHFQTLGPVHEDAVEVGIFLKSDRKLAEFRPRARSVLLWLILPEEMSAGPVRQSVRSGPHVVHELILRDAAAVDDDVRRMLESAYDYATD